MRQTKKMIFNRLILASMIFIMILSFSQSAFAESAPWVVADSAVVIDGTTGQVIYSKNMNTAYPPASTTKVMTALLTFENCDLDEIVTVPKEAVGIEGSKIWILEDEKISVRNMLHALIMESANDVATALAIHIGGTQEKFVEMMNEKARELGLQNTNFMNPHGLYNSKHKTSAYDLSKIMFEVVKYPEYIEISKTRGYRMPPTSKAAEGRPLWNGNKLVLSGYRYYSPLEAGKTGYTVQSQFSYVASAQKDGQRYIVALVHDSQKNYYADTVKLFKYAFNNFKKEKLFSQGDVITTFKNDKMDMPLLASEDIFMTLPTSASVDNLQITVEDIDDSKTYLAEEKMTNATLTLGNASVSTELLSSKRYTPVIIKRTILLGDNSSPADSYSKLPFFLVIVTIVMLIVVVRVVQIKKQNKRKRRIY